MQITVDWQDLKEILELVESAMMYATVDRDVTRAVALADLHARLEDQGVDPSIPSLREVTEIVSEEY